MLYASDMTGIHHDYLHIKFVITSLIWSMLSAAQDVDSHPSICHNEIQDIIASLMSEVCHAVGTEPCLQPVDGEQFTHRTANREEGVRLDIVTQSCWNRN